MRMCIHPGCDRGARPSRRKCSRHARSPNVCSIDGCICPRYERIHGYCKGHLRAFRETGDALTRRPYSPQSNCTWPGCTKTARRIGYCENHSAVVYRMRSSTGETCWHDPEPLREVLAPMNHYELARRSGVSHALLNKVARGVYPSQLKDSTVDRILTTIGRHIDEVYEVTA